MSKELNRLYKSIISTLCYIELVVDDKKQFAVVRKQLLDIANGIKRLDGEPNE